MDDAKVGLRFLICHMKISSVFFQFSVIANLATANTLLSFSLMFLLVLQQEYNQTSTLKLIRQNLAFLAGYF